MCFFVTTRDYGNRISSLQACKGMIALYRQRKDNLQWNRLSFLQACEGMIALYKQKKDNIQWNRLSFLQACEGMTALYKQRKDHIQGLLYSIYYRTRSELS